jgi:GNAT superfamily N-acetyltransferase
MDIAYGHEITVEEYNRLRVGAGWNAIEQNQAERGIRNSQHLIAAKDGGRTVGMARAVGDGGYIVIVVDVIVEKEYQGRGIGTRMMDMVMSYIERHAANNTIVGLMSAKGKELIYEKYGFARRPAEHYGAGMTLFCKIE